MKSHSVEMLLCMPLLLLYLLLLSNKITHQSSVFMFYLTQSQLSSLSCEGAGNHPSPTAKQQITLSEPIRTCLLLSQCPFSLLPCMDSMSCHTISSIFWNFYPFPKIKQKDIGANFLNATYFRWGLTYMYSCDNQQLDRVSVANWWLKTVSKCDFTSLYIDGVLATVYQVIMVEPRVHVRPRLK